MSGDAAVKFDRAELERFAAQRHLPEAVLAQLRARAKNEIEPAADGTFKVPLLKKVAPPAEKSGSSSATPAAREAPQLGRSQSAFVLGSSSFQQQQQQQPPPAAAVAIPRLSITGEDLSVSPTQQISSSSSEPKRPKQIAPLELSAINPVHRMPFNVESHTQQGADEFHAEENQDRHCFGYDNVRKLAWMGISDGHCGVGAADFIARNIVRLVSSCLPKGPPSSVEELVKGIMKGVQKTEEGFKKIQDGSGACLLLCCLWEDTLVVANVGDSRAIIGSYRNGTTQGFLLTNDHNPSNPVEAKLARWRFLRNQGLLQNIEDPDAISIDELIRLTKEAMDGDDIIVSGRLFSTECTRTIGDFGLKKACFNVITWEPEFSVCRLAEADSQLILGCDGVWRTIDAQRAVEIVQKAMELGESPAQRLVKAAVAEGSGDDQTCLVLDLINYRTCLAGNNMDLLSARIFKGLSVFDNNSAQALASSAHRTFSAKLARLHKSGGLPAGLSVSGVFEQNAKKTQTMASEVHRESRGKFDRAAAPAPYAGLSLFEQKPKAPASNPIPRRLAQSSLSVATDSPAPSNSMLSRSTDDSNSTRHIRTSSAGAASSMNIDTSSLTSTSTSTTQSSSSSTASPSSTTITRSSAMTIGAPREVQPTALSAPTLSILSRSQSSPQIEADSPSPSNSISHTPFALHACRLEDLPQDLLSDLRLSPPFLSSAHFFIVLSSSSPVGLLASINTHFGICAESSSSRVFLFLLPVFKSHAADVYRASAAHLFLLNNSPLRLECCIEAINLVECKALDDAGWRREGLLRGAVLTDAGRRDGALYAILRSDL